MSDTRLYLVEMEIGYQGTTFQDFLTIWLKEINFYLDQQKYGSAKHLFKAAAERKVFMVLENAGEELDTMLLTSPLLAKLGDQVKIRVTEMTPYETFANNLHRILKQEPTYEVKEPVSQTDSPGSYFWVEMMIGYSGHTLEDFLGIWCEEVAVAFGGKAKGVIVDIWKCVGERRVEVLCKFPSVEVFDNTLSFALPIMKKNGHNVEVKVNAVRCFTSLAEHLKKLTGVE